MYICSIKVQLSKQNKMATFQELRSSNKNRIQLSIGDTFFTEDGREVIVKEYVTILPTRSRSVNCHKCAFQCGVDHAKYCGQFACYGCTRHDHKTIYFQIH